MGCTGEGGYEVMVDTTGRAGPDEACRADWIFTPKTMVSAT